MFKIFLTISKSHTSPRQKDNI